MQQGSKLLAILLLGAMLLALPAGLLLQPVKAESSLGPELTALRTVNSKTFADTTDPEIFHLEASLAQLHYEASPGSGVFDQEVDFRPIRVINSTFDGWVVQESGWWYRLGTQIDKGTDGWVGFGGRRGEHFIDFRLDTVLYLHGPTRALDVLSDTPAYNRGELTRSSQPTLIGDRLLHLDLQASWRNIFTTPGGGNISLEWVISATGLKENVVLNKAAIDWLRANRPPGTPASETFFGYLFEVDWSDIPLLVKDGQTVDQDSDFDDSDGKTLELQDAQQRLLGLLPIQEAVSRDPVTGQDLGNLTLRKRFFQNTTGVHRLLIGARVTDLNALPSGDILYDPTVDVQIGAGADDTDTETGSWSNSRTRPDCPGRDNSAGSTPCDASFRWSSVAIPAGSTVTAATFEPHTFPSGDDGPDVRSNIYLEDADSPSAPSSLADFNGRTRTSAFTAWDGQSFADAFTISPDISAVVQEVLDRPGWSSGNAMQIFWDDDGSLAPDNHYEHKTYDNAPGDAAKLHITFTSGDEILLSNPTLTPASGTILTDFNFTIQYNHTAGDQAFVVKVNVSDAANSTFNNLTMTRIGPGPNATYFHNTTLAEGFYQHFFWANTTGDMEVNLTTTLPGPTVTLVPPSVTTLAANPVLGVSARLRGDLTDLGTATSVNVSFQWGDTMSLGNTTSPEETRTATGTYSFDLTGLLTSTQYFFRARAVGNGTAFGLILNFTTNASFQNPAIITVTAIGITDNEAVLTGDFDDFGELNITEVNVTFLYGLSPTALDFESTFQIVMAPAGFQITITDLQPGTTYFFRAKGVFNPTVLGEIKSFETTGLSGNDINLIITILATGLFFPFFLWLGWRVKNGGPEILAGISLVILAFPVRELLGTMALPLLIIAGGLLVGIYGVFVFYDKRKR